MAPKIVDKEKKRAQIAKAAGYVFGQNGFDKSKMIDVARAAGVGKGTLYEYYRDKESLIEGAFELLMEEMAADMYSALGLQKDPLQSLKDLSMATVEAMELMGEQYRFFFEYLLYESRRKKGFSALRRMLLEFRVGLEKLLNLAIEQGRVRKDLDVTTFAAAFIAWFDGAVLHWIAVPEGPDVKEMTEAYLDVVFRGIAPKIAEVKK